MASAPVKITSLFDESVSKALFNDIKLASSTIEEDGAMASDTTQDKEEETQPKVHKVSDRRMCSFCDVVFSSREEQVLHYKLDWHRFNLKQRIMGAEPVSEEKFELISGDVSSISGSDTEEEDSDKAPDTVPTASPSHSNDKVKTSSSTEESTDTKDGKGRRSAKVYFKNGTGEIFSVYRCLLHGKKDAPDSEDDLVSIATTLPTLANWTILMIAGGHFAGAVFSKSEVVVHKTFHRYTVRAKRGTAQGLKDSKQGGSHPKSAGANLRRYNESALNEDIRQLLASWSDHLKSCHRIFVRAPSYNKATFFGGKDAPLDRNDPRVVTVPFATRRPTQKEVTRVHEELATIECYDADCRVKDLPHKSPSRTIPKDPGRESPKRLQNTRKKVEASDTGSEPDTKQTRRPKSRSKKGGSHQGEALEDEDCGRDKNRGPKQPDPECLGSSSDDNEDTLILESSLEVINTVVTLKETGGTKKRKPRNRRKKPDRDDKGPKVMDRTKSCAIREEDAAKGTGGNDLEAAEMEQEIKRLEKELAERQLKNALFTSCKAGNAESLHQLLKHLFISNKDSNLSTDNGTDESSSAISEQQCQQLLDRPTNMTTLSNTSLDQGNMQSSSSEIASSDATDQHKATDGSTNCKTEDATAMDAACTVTLDMLVESLDDHGSTLLHVAARAGNKAVISLLMSAGADPSVRDKKGRPPYVVCSSKEVRNEFRRFMGENPHKYDYLKAQIPAPLTAEMEETRAAKQAEKRKAQKMAKKKREQEEREEKMKREKEEAEKTRFASLSDREKRALAAERRLAQQGQDTAALSNANRCWACGESLFGKVPFEYLDFKFCSMACLKEHKKNTTCGNS